MEKYEYFGGIPEAGIVPRAPHAGPLLRHVDGLSLEQVARECGMSVSGVRRRLRLLRDALREMGGPPLPGGPA